MPILDRDGPGLAVHCVPRAGGAVKTLRTRRRMAMQNMTSHNTFRGLCASCAARPARKRSEQRRAPARMGAVATRSPLRHVGARGCSGAPCTRRSKTGFVVC